MAIPLTGPISLGDLKNDTAASTASFDDPRIRRRYVSADGLKYGDQLPANTQMSLGDFRGSVLTLERDYAGAAGDLGTNPAIGLQTHQLVRDDAFNYSDSKLEDYRANPQYRRLQVRSLNSAARDVSVGMFSACYIDPSLLPCTVSLTGYVVSRDNSQRTILAVNYFTSGWLQGATEQPIWMDNLRSDLITTSFLVKAGHPWVTVSLMQVTRGSMGYEQCDWVSDNQSYSNAKFKVLDLRLT